MPVDAGPVLSVVVVSYNTRELTVRCLAELYADLAGASAGTSAEVFVVDNGSVDGSVATIREAFPDVSVIAVGRNAGFAAANNLAIARAAGEYILLLNSDAFVRPGAVAALVAYLRAYPGAAVVGPRLLNLDGTLQPSCFKFPSPRRAVCEYTLLTAAFPNHPVLGDLRAWPHDAERTVDFVIGACMLVRRAAIEQVGPFDEAFFMYAEETDWCRRFGTAGWTVGFTPAAAVTHVNGGSGKRQAKRVFSEFHRSAELYIRKHHGLSGLVIVRACLVGGSSLRLVLFGIAALVPGSRRPRKLVRQWLRILIWHLGVRGAGLRSGEKP